VLDQGIVYETIIFLIEYKRLKTLEKTSISEQHAFSSEAIGFRNLGTKSYLPLSKSK